MHKLQFFSFVLVSCLGFTACNKGSDNIGLNLQNNPDAGVYFTDTLTVQVSTVQMDSIITSGSNKILVGRYADAYTGTLQASSFFNLTASGSFKPETKAVFDSLTLTLRYSYSYADTTLSQTVNVHRLNQKLEDKTYYNTYSGDYEPVPVGKITFKARPRSGKPVIIRLSDAWGTEILARAKEGGLNNAGDVTDYFRGLALIPDASDRAAVLGFYTSGDSAAVKLYYHLQDLTEKKASVQNFSFSTYFTQIKTDRNNTLWQNLNQIRQAIPSKQTDEQVFLQSGANVSVRLDFPYLKTLNRDGKIYLNVAELVINPIDASLKNKTFTLPRNLQLYLASGNNQILGNLTNTQEGTGYWIDDTNTNDKYYVFPLTQHIFEQLNQQTETRQGLLLTIPATSGSEVNRLIAGSNKHPTDKIKLRLYYTKP